MKMEQKMEDAEIKIRDSPELDEIEAELNMASQKKWIMRSIPQDG